MSERSNGLNEQQTLDNNFQDNEIRNCSQDSIPGASANGIRASFETVNVLRDAMNDRIMLENDVLMSKGNTQIKRIKIEADKAIFVFVDPCNRLVLK